MNQITDGPPKFREPWKATLAIIVLANFRSLFGKWALAYLHARVLDEPNASAFLFLSLLRRGNDPVFTWHLLYLLRGVPDAVLEDKWISLKLALFDGVPASTMKERIVLLERIIFRTFDLTKASEKAHKAMADIDYEGLRN